MRVHFDFEFSWDDVSDWVRHHQGLMISFLYFLVAQIADVVTSVLPSPGEESNVFTRTAAHQFALGHGVAVKLIWILIVCLISGVIYRAVDHWNQQIAKVCAALPFIYYGTDVILNAVLGNLLLALRFYQP